MTDATRIEILTKALRDARIEIMLLKDATPAYTWQEAGAYPAMARWIAS